MTFRSTMQDAKKIPTDRRGTDRNRYCVRKRNLPSRKSESERALIHALEAGRGRLAVHANRRPMIVPPPVSLALQRVLPSRRCSSFKTPFEFDWILTRPFFV